MVCAGSKTKLIVIATEQLRRNRFKNKKMTIIVCDAIVEDSKSEKLLGLTVNNSLTWRDYLYGETWRPENYSKYLISQLSQCAGVLAKIANTMPSQRFKQICSGLFYRKLIHCIQIFGNVWNIPSCDETNRRSILFTKEDNRKLQVLQNKILRLKTGLPFEGSTTNLLRASGDLSVQQHTAYTSLLMAHKFILYQEPSYLATKFRKNQGLNSNLVTPPNYTLSVSRVSFTRQLLCKSSSC